MENLLNLYKLTTRKGTEFWAVAETYDSAVNKVTNLLNKNDYGFMDDRVVVKVELVAKEPRHNNSNDKDYFNVNIDNLVMVEPGTFTDLEKEIQGKV